MIMAWRRVRAVVDKEWAEVKKNRLILWSMAFLPILLVGTVLATNFYLIRADALGQYTQTDDIPIPNELADLSAFEAYLVQLNEQFMFYLLIIPMTLPVYIAAYSIVGEKQSKTLEPLLATPIETSELLAGKSIGATIPPVLLTWFSYAALLLGLKIIAPPNIFQYAARPAWLVGIGLLSPFLSLLSVLGGLIVSSRINDPRTAQQITAVFVMPLLGVAMAVLFKAVYINVSLILLAALAMLIVDLIVLGFAVKLFQREVILTRWR